MAFWSWSKTASSNAAADSSINWAEGQAPSSINDSARAMMARTAEFRDDISGAIVTGGTSTAYTVTSNQGFDTLGHMNGMIIAFSPHATNGATVTLNVDGLGAKPLRSAPSTELLAGVLILGTPYVAIYNNSDGAFYLQAFYGNPYNLPLAGALPFFGSTAPNSSFVFPYGQAISRSTYSALFAIFSTTFGTGDGSTTFNIPDLRGRIVAGYDSMGGSAAGRLTSASGTAALFSTAGAETKTLITANLPPYTPAGTVALTFPGSVQAIFNPSSSAGAYTANFTTSMTPTFTGTAQGGTSTPINALPPVIIGNFIMRII